MDSIKPINQHKPAISLDTLMKNTEKLNEQVQKVEQLSGKSREEINFLAQKSFTLFPAEVDHYFTNYYLIYWEPEFFKTVIEQGNGTITRGGITYLVVYHSCTPTELKEASQVKLSFRKPKKEYSSVGYVLVSCTSLNKED